MNQVVLELGERPAAIRQAELRRGLFSQERNLIRLGCADALRRTLRAELSHVGNAILRKRAQIGVDRIDMNL